MWFYKKWEPLDFKDINTQIKQEYQKVINIITCIGHKGEDLTIDLFSQRYLQSNNKFNVTNYFQHTIDSETKKGKIGNANVYQQTMSA